LRDLTGCGKTRRQLEKWRVDTFVVIPAKAGIQPFQRLWIPALRFAAAGMTVFCWHVAFFRNLLKKPSLPATVSALRR
jgi:hypothetical protein